MSRQVDSDSVRRMAFDRLDTTFNSVDPETGKVLICPHGPDPVLLGIRGEDPSELLKALSEVRVLEPIELVMLFKTNQGTDSHLKKKTDIARIRPHQSATLTGTVATPPIVIRGGHAIFKLHDETGHVDCAAYKPTGSLKDSVLQLIPGDQIIASGGVSGRRAGMTLNLERLEVLQLKKDWSIVRPHCSRCGSSCESMGKGQGFRCRKCGAREDRPPLRLVGVRVLNLGVHVPPPRANRHLTKPESRYLAARTRPAEYGEKENSSFVVPSFDELLQFTESLELGLSGASLGRNLSRVSDTSSGGS